MLEPEILYGLSLSKLHTWQNILNNVLLVKFYKLYLKRVLCSEYLKFCKCNLKVTLQFLNRILEGYRL